MKIAVVVVPYITNNVLAGYAQETLDSITSKYHELVKIAVINKCSLEYMPLFDKFDDVIQNDENCLARAWNSGIALAFDKHNADYVFIPNLDVILHESCIDSLAYLASECEAKNDNSVLWTGTQIWSKDELKLKFKIKTIIESPKFECFMVSKKTIEKVGFFNEAYKPAYFEDNSYHRKINMNGCRAIATSKAKFFHYGSATIKNDIELSRTNGSTFMNNKQEYIKEWGGEIGKETFATPYNR